MEEQLLLICAMIGGAAAIPFVSRRFRIPTAACEIVFGILLFNTLIQDSPQWFSLLKELGFIYLMFIAGMELDVAEMLKKGRRLVWLLLTALLPFALLPLVCAGLGMPFYLGITVSVVSVGIVLPVLKETGLSKTSLGRTIIDAGQFGELVSIAVLTGMHVYHEYGLSMPAALAALKLIALMVCAVVFLKLLYVAAWWHPQWVEKVMESEDPIEEGIRVVIAVAFVGALLAHYAGVEAILGSFMAGAVFNSVFKSRGSFEEKINAIGFGFFTPFFFIGIGAGFDPGLLASPSNILTALLLAALLLLGNLVPCLYYRKLGLDLRQTLSMALLLSAPLSMIVVAGTLGVKMGLLSHEMNSTLVLTALLASLLFPALFRVVARQNTGPAGVR